MTPDCKHNNLMSGAIYMIASDEDDNARCEVQCNPHGAQRLDGVCYCLPDNSPAFQLEGDV